jgi:hypothetical protein
MKVSVHYKLIYGIGAPGSEISTGKGSADFSIAANRQIFFVDTYIFIRVYLYKILKFYHRSNLNILLPLNTIYLR